METKEITVEDKTLLADIVVTLKELKARGVSYVGVAVLLAAVFELRCSFGSAKDDDDIINGIIMGENDFVSHVVHCMNTVDPSNAALIFNIKEEDEC